MPRELGFPKSRAYPLFPTLGMEPSKALRVQALFDKRVFKDPFRISRHYLDIQRWAPRLHIAQATKYLPSLVVFMIAYGSYAYCYLYLWDHIINFRADWFGAAFITIYCSLTALVVYTWRQIVRVGPGSAARIPQYDLGNSNHTTSVKRENSILSEDEESCFEVSSLPPVFVCDYHGYPLWCSSCQSVKIARVHHSVELGHCVPKMEHFCIWIGVIIGLSNYKLFIQFLFYLVLQLSFVVSTLALYARPFQPEFQSCSFHIIALFTLSLSWLVMLATFLHTHIRYILLNTTTLEQLNMNRNHFPLFNFKASDGMRVVTRIKGNDPQPYDLGRFENWKLTMGPNFLYWIVPISFPSRLHSPHTFHGHALSFNPELLALFDGRYLTGEEGRLAYPHLQRVQPNLEKHSEHILRHVSSRQLRQ